MDNFFLLFKKKLVRCRRCKQSGRIYRDELTLHNKVGLPKFVLKISNLIDLALDALHKSVENYLYKLC